jgi:hypothetical protein
MVDEGRRTLVSRSVHLDQQGPDFVEISLEGVEISTRLQMLRGCATVLFNEIEYGWKRRERGTGAYMDIPSSLIMYPRPYPSGEVGPKPNNLSAGFPQLEVESTAVLRAFQPGSEKSDGSRLTGIAAMGSSGLGSRFPPCSRREMQYKAYRCLGRCVRWGKNDYYSRRSLAYRDRDPGHTPWSVGRA